MDSLEPLAKERRRCFALCRGEGEGVRRGSTVEGFRVWEGEGGSVDGRRVSGEGRGERGESGESGELGIDE
jgi:hypothetical protein